MNIFQRIHADHHEIDGLLARLSAPPDRSRFDGTGRRYLLDRLVSTASRHEAAEELVLWPQVRKRVPAGRDLADEGLRHERDARALLDLARHVQTEEEIASTCRELRVLVVEHAAFEEEKVLPELAQHTGRFWAGLAGLEFGAARRTGPTRPHPGGPDRPIGLATRGAPAVVMDHLRDLQDLSRRHPVGFEDPDRADAIAVITRHHQHIDDLFARVGAESDPDDALVHQVIRDIAIHDSIERQYLYPAIRRRIMDGNRLYHALMSEHGRIGAIAADLDAYPHHDSARAEWLAELARTVRTHMEQEEISIFPALAARMTREELVDLGARLDAARSKAPTRPHRHVSGAALGARLVAKAAGPMDRARDVLAGRTHR